MSRLRKWRQKLKLERFNKWKACFLLAVFIYWHDAPSLTETTWINIRGG
jgi:hypothetical protein